MKIDRMLRAVLKAREDAAFVQCENIDQAKTPFMLLHQCDRIADGIIRRYAALQAENARLRAELEQARAFLKPLEEGWNDDPDAGDILDALSPAHDA